MGLQHDLDAVLLFVLFVLEDRESFRRILRRDASGMSLAFESVRFY